LPPPHILHLKGPLTAIVLSRVYTRARAMYTHTHTHTHTHKPALCVPPLSLPPFLSLACLDTATDLCVSVCLSVCVSVCLSVCLSVCVQLQCHTAGLQALLLDLSAVSQLRHRCGISEISRCRRCMTRLGDWIAQLQTNGRRMGILPNSTREGGGRGRQCVFVCLWVYVCVCVSVYARFCALDICTHIHLGPTHRNTGVPTHVNLGSIYCSLYANFALNFAIHSKEKTRLEPAHRKGFSMRKREGTPRKLKHKPASLNLEVSINLLHHQLE
jgi:hypothetical protein